MVQLRVTEGIRLVAERASTSKSVSPIAAEAAKDIAGGKDISRVEFAHVKAWHRAGAGGGLALHEVLRGSEIIRDPPPVMEPHPDLVMRRERLKLFVAERQYQSLVTNIEPKRDFERAPMEVQEVRRQISVVVNVLASAIAVFVFGFYASQYAFTTLAARVLSGIICALAALLAELWFLMRASIAAEIQEEHTEATQRAKVTGAKPPRKLRTYNDF